MKYTHPLAHPSTRFDKVGRQKFQRWIVRRQERGLGAACHGFYLFSITQQREQRAAHLMTVRHVPPTLRPDWCTPATLRNWRNFQRKRCAGMPLHIYADLVKRKEYLDALTTRPATPREAAEALLKRKGLAP